MYGVGDVRVEEVADPKLEQPTDALVRIVRACVCGSDLHPYHQMTASPQGVPMGHEFVGVVEAAGSEVAERGEEGTAKVLNLTGGDGTHVVVEAVGHRPAYDMAIGVVRVGGTISRVGVPQYEEAPVGFASLFGKNVTLTGGSAPVRAYIEELLPEVLDGRLEPGQVFDRTVSLEEVPAGYRLMDDRESIKVLVTP